ncbi:MAG: phosphoribosylformimino-5-aminoimidazole carboxamide ribotide isomerase [Thermotogota bacterium]|nr:phosphoribosylformimino-5-aminoimidazole carboxamide ribotide isomerase [Thermotogota bacterium]MDK2864318.1 phosphoribosylformimino-5-aminoimidazole carboxamide ribotide isomerase [Thermotogota bacterium]HCZ06348.1 1-(5-phosphoribosyl)-5-((5-phosphoribosylamino)methylideneamino)imidazole-4-carboxamide isomerase [Thermotogota bacterium]
MKIYPAIDLMNGKVVRLIKGRKESVKVYGDPVEIARRFSRYVAKVHMVDLDGAFSGEPKNMDAVRRVIEETGLKVQLGGGFRDYKTIEKAYNLGVENVILGTAALDIEFLKIVTRDFEGITVSLDVKKGRLTLKGWIEETSLSFKDAFEVFRGYVSRFVYTDVERDGTLEGISHFERFWDREEMIYAGGVSSADDVLILKERGFSGVIVGKALYEGKVGIEELVSVLGDEDAG